MKCIMTQYELAQVMALSKEVYAGLIPEEAFSMDIFKEVDLDTPNFKAKFDTENGLYIVEMDERVMIAVTGVYRRHSVAINGILHLCHTVYTMGKGLIEKLCGDMADTFDELTAEMDMAKAANDSANEEVPTPVPEEEKKSSCKRAACSKNAATTDDKKPEDWEDPDGLI